MSKAAGSSLRERILEAARDARVEEVEGLVLELVAEAPSDPEFYEEFTVAMTKAKVKPRALAAVALFLAEIRKKEDWRSLSRVLGAIARHFPDSTELRALGVDLLKGMHGSMPEFDRLLQLSKIRDDDQPVDQGIKRFRGYMRLLPGQVYRHAEWGEGVVASTDLQKGRVVIDFPREKAKEMTFAGVKNYLAYLAPTHFLARRAKEPEKLALLAEDDPLAVIRMVLDSNEGRIKQSDLKVLLTGGVIDASAWNAWWQKARGELRLDPMIDFDPKGGAHAEIVVRKRPKSFEDECTELFFGEKSDLSLQIEAVQRFEKESKVKPPVKLLERMLTKLEEDFRVSEGHLNPAERLEYSFLKEDVRRLGGLPERPGAIPRVDLAILEFGSYADLASVNNVEYGMRALKLLIARDGADGLESAVELLPHAPVRLAQAIWKELDEERHLDLAVKAMERLLARPLANPETWYWAMKAIVERSWEHLDDYFPPATMVLEIMDHLDAWGDMLLRPGARDKADLAAARTLTAKIKTLLAADKFSVLCKAVEELLPEQAQRLRRSIQTSSCFNEQFRQAADRQLVLTRKDLEKPAPAAASAEPEFHYCTARARAEKLVELSLLNNEEIPSNSKEIEEARQEGDLRENAGYHAAKDKQKMLMQKSLQLQQAITSSRVFLASQVKTESIGFGTRFVAENLKKKGKDAREEYVVLGRWEANPDKRILSYLAPMMQQFLERKAGEEVTIKHPGGGETPYRILSISNALESGEWDVVEGKDA